MNNRIFWFGFIILHLLMFWAIHPLFSNGYFPIHDDTQVARVIVMGNALKDGQFPVRWVSDLGYGYGYPIYNFYGPLPYYFGGALYAVGVNPVIATKLMFAEGILLAAIFCYLFLYPVAGAWGSILGAVLVTYAPYHAVQIYVRGAVGEYWATAFVPLALLGVYTILHRRFFYGIALGSIGLFGIIMSHTILGMLSMLLLGILIPVIFVHQAVWNQIRWRVILSLCGLCLFGLGLSSFFWLPAFVEMNYTGVSSMVTHATTGFYDHFVCLGQLWNSPWGFGGSAPGCLVDGMSFKLGKFHILLSLFTLIIITYQIVRKRKIKLSFQLLIGLLLGFISIILMLQISDIVWKLYPLTPYIQYPWRLLSFCMLSIGFFCGSSISLIRSHILRFVVVVTAVVLTIAINGKLFFPQYVYPIDYHTFSSEEDIRYRVSKISDEYLPIELIRPKTSHEAPMSLIKESGGITGKTQINKSNYFRVFFANATPQPVVVQKAYFPGWKFTINGHLQKPDIIRGLPVFRLPAGSYMIEGEFTNTPIRSEGNITSALFLLLLGGFIYYGYKTNA